MRRLGVFGVIIAFTGVLTAQPAGAVAYESALNKKTDMHWCTSTQPWCVPGNFARFPQGTRVHMVCWRDDRPAYAGSSPRWFYVFAPNGQEGYVHSSTISPGNQIPTPDCSTINWIAVADWAIAHIGQRVSLNPAERNAFTEQDWKPGEPGQWAGDCAKFAELAWGKNLRKDPPGNAINIWNAYARVGQVDTNKAHRPPRGALVFWNVGGYGHVAVSLGNWRAVGTQGMDWDPGPPPVEFYGIPSGPGAKFPASTYLGWTMPHRATVPQNL